MNADRVITDWLHDSAPARAPQTLLTVTLERVATTSQEAKATAVVRDLTGRRSSGRLLLIAATLVGVALLGSFLAAGGRHNANPSPIPSVSAISLGQSPTPVLPTPLTPLPTPVLPVVRGTLSPAGVPVHEGLLPPGRYETAVDDAGFAVQFTVPAGWSWDGRALRKGAPGLPDGAAIFFYGGQLQVYSDPCHWETRPPTAPTEDVVDALRAAQPGRIVTSPLDGGWGPAPWLGTAIEVIVPQDTDIAACDGGQYRSWGPDGKVRSNEGPGERDLIWFWGVPGYNSLPGGLVVDRASFPGTPADALSEMDDILGSLYVGHWG